MKKTKENKAITLVALVITIIILLILAGIAISQLTSSGLFQNVQTAKSEHENAQEREDDILKQYENAISTGEVASDRDGIVLTEEQYKALTDRLEEVETYRAGNLDFGAISANSCKVRSVTFSKPLKDANYSVCVNATSDVVGWATTEFLITNKTVNGFSVSAYNNLSIDTGNLIANWILIHNNV